MSYSYAINPIDSLSYANDSMAMAALKSPNYYQLLAAQQTSQSSQVSQPAQTQTVTTAPSYSPSFQGTSAGQEDSGIGMGTILGGIAAVGALAFTYAAYKKGGSFKNIPEGAKQLLSQGTNWVKGLLGKSEKNILENVGKNLKEYTVTKDGVEVLMKDGNPIKIITKEKEVLTKAKDISKFVKDNDKIRTMISGLDVSGKLPKGVSLSYTKEVKDGKNLYKMIVENGKIVKASSKDKAGKWVEVANDQMEAFLKNHKSQANEALTLTKTLKGQTVRLADGATKTGDLRMSVRNGNVIEAFIDGKKLADKEIAMLKNDFGQQISQFGKENGSLYGLKNYEFIYRTKADAANGIIGGQKFRFNTNVTGHTGQKWITEASVAQNRTITDANGIKQYLENNSQLQSAINGLSSGRLAEGFRVTSGSIVSGNNNIFGVNPNTKKVVSITLKDGKVLTGKDISEWRKIAENNNEYNSIIKQLS